MRGVVVTGAALLSLAAALVNVQLTTCMLAAGLGGTVVASFILSFFSLFRMDLRRGYGRDGRVGEPVSLPVEIRNRNRLTRQAVLVREICPFSLEPITHTVVAPLRPRETRLVNRKILARRRGRFKLNEITLVGGDPAGLFRREKRFRFPEEIMIFPESVKLSWMPIRIKRLVRPSVTGRPIGTAGVGQDFFGIREYRHSDGVRFIHWKASAKRRKLVVRELEGNSVTQVNIALDVDRRHVSDDGDDSNFEFLIKTAASMLDYLATSQCDLLFATGLGDKPATTLERGTAFGVQKRLTHTLALLEPAKIKVDQIVGDCVESVPPNSIFYCLSMSEPTSLNDHFSLLLDRGVDVRWIYAPRRCFPKIGPARERAAETGKIDYADKFGVIPFLVTKNLNIGQALTYG